MRQMIFTHCLLPFRMVAKILVIPLSEHHYKIARIWYDFPLLHDFVVILWSVYLIAAQKIYQIKILFGWSDAIWFCESASFPSISKSWHNLSTKGFCGAVGGTKWWSRERDRPTVSLCIAWNDIQSDVEMAFGSDRAAVTYFITMHFLGTEWNVLLRVWKDACLK